MNLSVQAILGILRGDPNALLSALQNPQGDSTGAAAAAGVIGEVMTATTPGTSHTATVALGASATVTITIATPGVVTWTAHGLTTGALVKLTTTGALPTGLTAGSNYYVIVQDANTFLLSSTQGGAPIATSGTQSGTQTAQVIAAGVVTWTAHGLTTGSVVTLTTTGALPTGLTAATPYFVTVIDANTFTLSATATGAAITTSGTQSGTHTATASVTLTTATAANIATLTLTPGRWSVSGVAAYHGSGTTPADVKQGPSATSSTIGAFGTYSYDYVGLALSDDPVYPTPVSYVNVPAGSTQVVYLIAFSDFTGGALTAYGSLSAERRG